MKLVFEYGKQKFTAKSGGGKMNGEAIRICPGCNCKVEMSLLEYPALYDGWIEYLCPKCHTRVGRWSGKVMAKGEYEDPILRLKEEKWTIKK